MLDLSAISATNRHFEGLSSGAPMFRSAYRPGEDVPATGVYWVYHYAHRISHPAKLERGEKFPECHECGERVRFEPAAETVTKAQNIHTYTDFKEAA